VAGLHIHKAKLADHHPLEMVPAHAGFDQEDLALGMKNRKG